MKYILLPTLFILQTLMASTEQKISETVYACVDGYTANLRSEPDIKASKVATLSKYQPIQIINKDEEWTQIKTGNYEGWLYNELLSYDVNCVMSLKSAKTQMSFTSRIPHKLRKSIKTNEGFKIIKTEIGMTQVQDRTGNIFWLENHLLWPKSGLQDLKFSL